MLLLNLRFMAIACDVNVNSANDVALNWYLSLTELFLQRRIDVDAYSKY